MKAKKVIAIILLVLGSIALLFGGFFYGKEFVYTRGIKEYNPGSTYNNQLVAINGGLVTDETAYDKELETGCDSAILLREVKMLQWVNDGKGIRLALVNYPIDSFEVEGKKYTNPNFYNQLYRVVNHGVLMAGNIKIDSSVLDLLANTSFVEKTQVEDVNINVGAKYGLAPYNGSYVSASDEWSIGEAKIDLYEVTDESLEKVTIIGKVNNNVLSDAKVLNGSLSVSEIQSTLLKDNILYLLIGGCGLVVILIGILLLAIKSGKKNEVQE